MTKTKSEEAIDKLISQAADAGDANDAMKFSQAALNVANAAMARNETRGADFTPDRPSISTVSMMLQNWMDQKHMVVQEVDRSAAKPLFDAVGLNVDDYI